jgi:NAD-dependent deacetylase
MTDSVELEPITFDDPRRIVVLTGAGVSAASGLDTYRGQGGIWEKHDVATISHPRAFIDHPQRSWRFYGGRRAGIARAAPNAAHRALATFESRRDASDFLVVTQNIDGLHGRAGSRRAVELHGNLMTSRCANPDCDLAPYPDDDPHEGDVPRCPRCGASLRPDIVLFGEALSARVLDTVVAALDACDLFVAIGTSGTVYPAAGFAAHARTAGARTVLLNLEVPDARDAAYDAVRAGPAERLVPMLFGGGTS